MKVDRPNPEYLDGVSPHNTESVKKRGKTTPKETSKISSSELGSAKVKLSERAQDMKKVRAAVDATPDADEAKIAKFKNLINSGQYKVDAKAVADKMVDEHAYNEFFNGED
jgi:negative regulator of flagellin synthesis FlgM